MRLGCLFIVVPLVELALLIQVGRWVGVLPTVTLVAVTGLLGIILVRREGTRTLRRIEGELQAGRLPHGALMDGAALLVAGAFLMTPGVLTDALAFALLFPFTRTLIRERTLARMRRAMEKGTFQVRTFRAGSGFPPGGGAGVVRMTGNGGLAPRTMTGTVRRGPVRSSRSEAARRGSRGTVPPRGAMDAMA